MQLFSKKGHRPDSSIIYPVNFFYSFNFFCKQSFTYFINIICRWSNNMISLMWERGVQVKPQSSAVVCNENGDWSERGQPQESWTTSSGRFKNGGLAVNFWTTLKTETPAIDFNVALNVTSHWSLSQVIHSFNSLRILKNLEEYRKKIASDDFNGSWTLRLSSYRECKISGCTTKGILKRIRWSGKGCRELRNWWLSSPLD